MIDLSDDLSFGFTTFNWNCSVSKTAAIRQVFKRYYFLIIIKLYWKYSRWKNYGTVVEDLHWSLFCNFFDPWRKPNQDSEYHFKLLVHSNNGDFNHLKWAKIVNYRTQSCHPGLLCSPGFPIDEIESKHTIAFKSITCSIKSTGNTTSVEHKEQFYDRLIQVSKRGWFKTRMV